MENFLDSISSFFRPKSASPQFQNGQPAIDPNATYLKQTTPDENQWIQGQMSQYPSETAGDLAKTYYNTNQALDEVLPKKAVLAAQTPTPTSPPDASLPTLLNTKGDEGSNYDSLIMQASKQYNVPAPTLKGMLAHESWQFNPKYIGGYHTDGTGRGIAAIDKNAHPEITDAQAFDPSYAIPWAAKTLSGYQKQEGNWFNALRRYNGGPNYNTDSPGYQGVPVAQRTHDYAMNVLSQAKRFASGYGNTQRSQ